MRTIRRYEASDIDPENTVHTFLMAAISISILELRAVKKDNVMEGMKETIANVLNMATDMGVDITEHKDAEFPKVYREAFSKDDQV
jgi:hypothetical protein